MNAKNSSYVAISNWRELQVAGITALTGEACTFSMRQLCDVNESGKELLQEYFGIQKLTLAAPWNSTVNGQPSIGSIMLGHQMLEPLAEFFLAREKALALVYINKRIAGGIFDQEVMDDYISAELPLYEIRRLGNGTGPSVGSRNVHAATGRVD